MAKTSELAAQGRMLSISEVLSMWPMSRQALWKLSNSKNEDTRIPSYKVGGKRLYNYDELMWYLDKHKTMPSETTPRRSKQ